jgi:hypothetical protein
MNLRLLSINQKRTFQVSNNEQVANQVAFFTNHSNQKIISELFHTLTKENKNVALQ